MGDRAVITTENKDVGIYVHWNGGKGSVKGFLTYCKMQGFRNPEDDNYGWARLCQIIGNFFGGANSVGIDKYECLDLDNGDNGVYIIKDWKIVGREFFKGAEDDIKDLIGMLLEIDSKQPEFMQLGETYMKTYLSQHEIN